MSSFEFMNEPSSPRYNSGLMSVQNTVMNYIKQETSFSTTRRTISQQSVFSSSSSSRANNNRPRSSIDSPEGASEALSERLREPMLEMFTRLVQGKSWSMMNKADIELISAKFDRSLILRVQGEAVVVFTPQSCLLQCKAATALQKAVLEIFVEMCAWKWAFITFENEGGLVLKNRNNARARYPLSAALRIEVPVPLQRLCAQVKLLLCEAASLETVQRRQSRMRSAFETNAADEAETPFADANSDSDEEQDEKEDGAEEDDDASSSTEIDEEQDEDEDELAPRAAAAAPTLTSLPAPRRRRSRRRGFCRADDSRVLYRLIERNIVFPSETLLQKRREEEERKLKKLANVSSSVIVGKKESKDGSSTRLKRRNSTQLNMI